MIKIKVLKVGFNSTIVRLTVQSLGNVLPGYTSFNSTIVRLTDGVIDSDVMVDTRFNSTIVRLTVASNTLPLPTHL